jgi:hypothetical protein
VSAAPVVELHIEELVLHGFAPGDRHRIADAVQAELARRLGEVPVDAQARRIAHLDAGAFQLPPRAPAAAVGSQVAGALHTALTGGKP